MRNLIKSADPKVMKLHPLTNMRGRLIGLFLFVSCMAMGSAFALTLTPVKVAPDVYAFIGDTGGRTYENYGMNANTGFIVTTGGVVVIDSGAGYLAAQAMHRAIKQVTRQPVKYVVNTGGQDHRWLGNGYFREQGAEIIAARPARADMEQRAGMQLDALRVDLKERLDGTQPVYPDRLFEQRETLRLGGTEIQLQFFSGGHTPGDSVVWLPKQKVLFSGDLVYVDRLLGVLPFSNSRNWLASFEQMEKLKPNKIVPGHGKVCDLDLAQRDTRDYLRLLRGHMQKAYDSGADLQTAIDSLDQKAFSRLQNYETLKGGNASRVYLEIEAE
ncbi:SoxH like protein [Sulfuricella denitrificans skB26]|uniref:SoxH like protein n=1 Tax=Sulfuricella denitrificans (strain DSM 22764 / NBRC 105220 / skB26) TaxID=1163617 RepID=S6AKZ1_SULDS|nr:MBL fold metallo-hydrolase [Sulfuricella denitrificans]BAN35249.1 SoxH like protein [Sulfuricella denitrificans skB26]